MNFFSPIGGGGGPPRQLPPAPNPNNGYNQGYRDASGASPDSGPVVLGPDGHAREAFRGEQQESTFAEALADAR